MKKIFLIIIMSIGFYCNHTKAITYKLVNDGYYLTTNQLIERILIDNKLSFCLEPGVKTGINNYTKNDFLKSYNKISLAKKELIQKYALYSEFHYTKTKNIAYYYAGQELIWQEISSKNFKFKKDLQSFKSVISKDVKAFNNKLKWQNQIHVVKSGGKIELVDDMLLEFSITNKANFELKTGLKVSLVKNKLTISNPAGNQLKQKEKLKFKKFTNKFSAGISYAHKNTILQDYVSVKNSFNIESSFEIQPIIPIGSLEGYKYDENNKPLKDIQFSIFENNKLIKSVFSDEKGYFIFKDLPTGNYVVKETQSFDIFEFLKDEFKVKILENKIAKINEENKVINYYRKGRIKVIKEDEDKNRLKDIEFGVYLENDLVDVIKTNVDGEGISKPLKLGDYKVKEIKTLENLILSDVEYNISVCYECITTINNNKPIINKFKLGKIKFKKINQNNVELENVEFGIYDTSYNLIKIAVSNNNGIVEFDQLKYGKYIIKEIKELDGYLKNNKEISVELSKDKIILDDVVNVEDLNAIIIEKLDIHTKEVVAGAKFIIENENYKKEFISKGSDTFNNLNKGCYIIKEVDPPKNYQLSNVNEQKVCLENQTSKKITFENKPLNLLQIEKYDANTNDLLSDTEFEIRGVDTKNYYVKKTDDNGQIRLKLPDGCFEIRESRAKKGYLINKDVDKICFTKNKEINKKYYNVSVINVKTGVKNKKNLLIFVILGIALLLFIVKKGLEKASKTVK